MTKFDDATQAIKVDDTTYDVCLDAGYTIGTALNGGYLMAVLLRAVVDASPHDHPVATSAQFLRVARPGPATVRLGQIKSGRTTTVTRATLVQDGTPYVEAFVTTANLRPYEPGAEPGPGELTWSAPPPPMPRSRSAGRARPPPESNMPFNAQVELLFDLPTIGWYTGTPTGRPEMRAYFRLAEPQDPDPFVIALAVDALPPVVFSAGARGWAPTVELTWYLRALPAPAGSR